MVNKTESFLKNRVFIALGSNLSIPKSELLRAPQTLVESAAAGSFRIESISPYYQTPAFPEGSGPDFVNAVFEVSTDLSAEAVLGALHDLEAKFGRERPYRWAPRTLDLDLVFYGDAVRPDGQTWREWANLSLKEAGATTPAELILPHPRMHERSFVLGPLNDIAPEFVHPVLQKSIREIWLSLPLDERETLRRV